MPAEDGQVVPINVDRADAPWNWTPDHRIGPDAVTGGKLDRAKGLISKLGDGQDFRPPSLGLSDQGLGSQDGRNRFAAMRDMGFRTAPASMHPESIAYARRLGLVDDAPPRPGVPREVGTGPRPDAPAYDPDCMRAPPRPDVPRPQDLRAFVKARGGMVDTGGDLASMGLNDLIGRGGRGVNSDRMREAAAEAGYLGADTARAMRETHPNDLLDALSGDRPVHWCATTTPRRRGRPMTRRASGTTRPGAISPRGRPSACRRPAPTGWCPTTRTPTARCRGPS